MVDPASPGAQRALGHYFDEIGAAFGFETGTALADAATAYAAAAGAVRDRGAGGGARSVRRACSSSTRSAARSSGCGWPRRARGRGLAGALLAHLEALILAAGRRRALLDTNSSLAPAVGLYESRGYRRVPDYNGNVDADVWFAKDLG